MSQTVLRIQWTNRKEIELVLFAILKNSDYLPDFYSPRFVFRFVNTALSSLYVAVLWNVYYSLVHQNNIIRVISSFNPNAAIMIKNIVISQIMDEIMRQCTC